MVAAAKDNPAHYSNVLVTINSAAPMSKSAASIIADLALPLPVIDIKIRTGLLAMKDAKGRKMYQSGTTNVEGAAGQYFHP
jgi:hypothetical protein